LLPFNPLAQFSNTVEHKIYGTVLPVLYGCKIQSLTIREEYGLSVQELGEGGRVRIHVNK
jgi:hypothetical protein